jgi:hypothetical protein
MSLSSDMHCKDIGPKIGIKCSKKETVRISPNFYIHISVSDLYIWLQENIW